MLWEQQQRFSLGPVSFLWALVLGGFVGYKMDRQLAQEGRWTALYIARGVSLSWIYLGVLWGAVGRRMEAVAVVLEACAVLLLLLIPATVWGE